MKRLNNKGWGLIEMLIISAVILLILIIAAVMIYRFYSSMEL